MLRKLVYAGLAALSLGGALLAMSTPAEARYWHRGFGLSFGFGTPGFGWGGPFWGNPGYGYGFGYQPYYYEPEPAYRYDGAYPACEVRRVRVHTPYGWRWRARRFCW